MATTATIINKSAIGTSAVQLTATPTTITHGVIIKASPQNSGRVFIGFSSGVTAGTVDATDGFELGSSEGIFLAPADVADLSSIWLIGSAAGQRVSVKYQ